VNRWEAAPPFEWSGAWEGRLQAHCGYGTKSEMCGHLHGSSAEAERCAQQFGGTPQLQARACHARIPERMPSEYYLG
jgi:hypothetical protein